MSKNTHSRIWKAIANLLFAGGAVAIGISGSSYVRQAVYQDWQNWVFEKETHSTRATVGEYLAEREHQIVADLRARLGLPAYPIPGPPATPLAVMEHERPPVRN